MLLGIGTAMVYPSLLSAIGDVAQPAWRASSVGVCRLWRDLGCALGALLAGITTDLFGLAGAMWLVAAITFASGVATVARMTETLQIPQRIKEESEGDGHGKRLSRGSRRVRLLSRHV
jgi:MFS family permease